VQDLLGFLLTLLALLIAFKLARPITPPRLTLLPPASCDLQRETCQLTLPGKLHVTLSVPGRPIVPNQSFVIEARGEHGRIELLSAQMHGVETPLSGDVAAFSDRGDDSFSTRVNIPLCTTSRMNWQLRVLLRLDGQFLEWPLPFNTETAAANASDKHRYP
jgi:hypothetical protein